MRASTARRPDGESGQSLVLFAFMAVAMIGFLALAIDLGFLFGQRRFDQNGADSAALAAGRLLASNVAALNNSGGVYFHVRESTLYNSVVRLYAGLDTANPSSTAPTGVNQNPGLTGRNALAVTLEYWTGAPGAGWCYSPSGPQPPRSPAVPPCTLPTAVVDGQTVSLPPHPTDQPYKVRVTVSSTTNLFFWPAFAGLMGGSADITPAPPTSDAVAACVRANGASGDTTCAHAVVAIKGSSEFAGEGPVIPVTTADCQITSKSIGELFQLWGSQPADCGTSITPWKNMLDLTKEEKWCDEPSGGSTSNPDYKYYSLLPYLFRPGSSYLNLQCQVDPGENLTGDSWHRQTFVPDPTWPGTGQTDTDIPAWIARGFRGSIHADPVDGNRMPTYGDDSPAQGATLGQNIAAGFYCGQSGVSATSCPTSINPAGTYFFAQDPQNGFDPGCTRDQFYAGKAGGCRDATVPTWLDPEWAKNLHMGGIKWQNNGGGGPDRVQVIRLLNMRIYCDNDNDGLCTVPPKSIVGSAANSEVWGLFLGPWIPGPCPTCSGPPSLNGNTAQLE